MGNCGGAAGNCFCDDICTVYDDCCPDAIEVVGYFSFNIDVDIYSVCEYRLCVPWLARSALRATDSAAELVQPAASVTTCAPFTTTAAQTPSSCA